MGKADKIMERIKTTIVNRWIISNIIEEKDRELYEYGIEITIEYFINIFTTVIIALVTGEILSCIAMMASFMSLRSYAGGVHASSFRRCYMYSSMVILMSLVLIRYDLLNIWIYRIAAIINTVYLFIMPPAESENRRVTDKEREVYRCKEKVLLLCINLSALLCAVMELIRIEKGFESTLIITGISVLISHNKRRT